MTAYAHSDNNFVSLTSHQEDSHQFAALSLNPEELRLSAKRSFGIEWNPEDVGDAFARQVLFVGIYDGYVVGHVLLWKSH